MTEGELQALVNGQLEAEGWLWHHCRDSRSCSGSPGFPDVIALRGPLLRIAELKSDDGRCSRDQLEWRRRFGHARIEVPVLRPEDWRSGLIGEWLSRER